MCSYGYNTNFASVGAGTDRYYGRKNPIVIVITDTAQQICNFIAEVKDASRMSRKLRLMEKYS